MIPNDKLAYLNGLIKGMKLTGESNEDKLFLAITGALNEMYEIIESYDDAFDGLAEVIADVEESVYELEDEVFGDEKPDIDDYDSLDDDDIYDITCSNCDNLITVDYDALDDGSVTCPGCGELIEFTIEIDDE
jgi:Mg2+ and Co2+ transporter CorA